MCKPCVRFREAVAHTTNLGDYQPVYIGIPFRIITNQSGFHINVNMFHTESNCSELDLLEMVVWFTWAHSILLCKHFELLDPVKQMRTRKITDLYHKNGRRRFVKLD